MCRDGEGREEIHVVLAVGVVEVVLVVLVMLVSPGAWFARRNFLTWSFHWISGEQNSCGSSPGALSIKLLASIL